MEYFCNYRAINFWLVSMTAIFSIGLMYITGDFDIKYDNFHLLSSLVVIFPYFLLGRQAANASDGVGEACSMITTISVSLLGFILYSAFICTEMEYKYVFTYVPVLQMGLLIISNKMLSHIAVEELRPARD